MCSVEKGIALLSLLFYSYAFPLWEFRAPLEANVGERVFVTQFRIPPFQNTILFCIFFSFFSIPVSYSYISFYPPFLFYPSFHLFFFFFFFDAPEFLVSYSGVWLYFEQFLFMFSMGDVECFPFYFTVLFSFYTGGVKRTKKALPPKKNYVKTSSDALNWKLILTLASFFLFVSFLPSFFLCH